jgi:predicted TIM-barrel fold metal-dependent hydrolase
MARYYQVISADGHVETPPESWVRYVPDRHRARAPRLIKLASGGEGWVVEGQPLLANGQNISPGRIRFSGASYYQPDGSAAVGAGSAAQRLREQDQDGIDAEVLFPPVFASRFIEGISDRDAYRSMVRAYNTFLAQDFCSVAPDRLIGAAVMPVTGVDDALAELEYATQLGLDAISFHQFPNGSGFAGKDDDRFWGRCLELDVAIAPHIGFGATAPPPVSAAQGTGSQTFTQAMSQRAGSHPPVFCLIQLILSGVFDRFPDIRFYFAETNAHWLPGSLFILDDNYAIFRDVFGVTLKMKPSEYVTRHCHFGIIRDPVAIRMRELLPMDNIMWASDFPHSVGSYPDSRRFLDEAFAGVDDSLRRKVLLENPARYFGLDLTEPITETPA